MFNARRWLNDAGIPYFTAGKNVTEGWTTLSCPFCGDRSNHGGISPDGLKYSCYKCGPKGSVVKLIKHILQIDHYAAKTIFDRYASALDIGYYTEERTRASAVTWPRPEFEVGIPSIFSRYLYTRGYQPSQIENLYGIKACYITGDFKYRLVIPVVENNRIVTYVGRDVTGKSQLKYKNLKEELSIKPAKDCIYNIDSVGDTAIIVEGIFDVWRLKYNAVATLGLIYTRAQVRMLSKRLKKAFICFDAEPDAQEMANGLGEELAMTGVDVYIVVIDKKDPDCLSEEEAENIRKIVATY